MKRGLLMWIQLCCGGVGLGWGGVMRCDVM